MCSPDLFLAVLAILFPPVAVWIKVGICTADSIINIALCCLGYIPGLLHAWYTILKHPEPDDEYVEGYRPVGNEGHEDNQGGRVTYYYVAHENRPSGPSENNHQGRSYGTTHASNNQHQQNQHYPEYAAVAARPPPPVPGMQSSHSDGQSGQHADGGEGDSNYHPPTYAEAVKADNKIQTQD